MKQIDPGIASASADIADTSYQRQIERTIELNWIELNWIELNWIELNPWLPWQRFLESTKRVASDAK